MKRKTKRKIYLLQRVKGKTFLSWITGRHEIGISLIPNGSVKKKTSGVVVHLKSYNVGDARRVKNRIYRKYKKSIFEISNLVSSQSVDFYRLTSGELKSLQKSLAEKESGVQWADPDFRTPPMILVTIVSFLLMLAIQYLKDKF